MVWIGVQCILGALEGVTVMVNYALSMVVPGSFGWSSVTGRLFALSRLTSHYEAPRGTSVSPFSRHPQSRGQSFHVFFFHVSNLPVGRDLKANNME
jgi:hypothetical protein